MSPHPHPTPPHPTIAIFKNVRFTGTVFGPQAYTCRCWAVSPEQPAGQKEQTGGEHGQREAPTAVAAQQSEALQLG